MNYEEAHILCKDRCTTLRFNYDLDEEYPMHSFEFLSSNIVQPCGLKERIKRAWAMLVGKPVYYAEILVEAHEAKRFCQECLAIIEKGE